MKSTREADPAGTFLARFLHDQVDDVRVSEDRWDQISAVMDRRRRLRLRLAPVAILAVAAVAAVAAAVTVPFLLQDGDSTVVAAGTQTSPTTPIWPATSRIGADWQRDPRQTALRFLAGIGVPSKGLSVDGAPGSTGPVPVDADGNALVPIRTDDGVPVAEVVLQSSKAGAKTWRVTSVRSAALFVRSPSTGNRFDPPLSVSFRTTGDARVVVRLYAVGVETPLGEWSGDVDAAQDWTANANFTRTRPGTEGYVTVTSVIDGVTAGVSVTPVVLGS